MLQRNRWFCIHCIYQAKERWYFYWYSIIRRLVSMIVSVISLFPAVPLEKLHYRALEKDKTVALKKASRKFGRNNQLGSWLFPGGEPNSSSTNAANPNQLYHSASTAKEYIDFNIKERGSSSTTSKTKTTGGSFIWEANSNRELPSTRNWGSCCRLMANIHKIKMWVCAQTMEMLCNIAEWESLYY